MFGKVHVGKVYSVNAPYYDLVTKKDDFKPRPCLVIGEADEGDYVVLPISKISKKSKVDPNYDIPLDKSVYTFLKYDSYLRTHKMTTANIASFVRLLADFRTSYEDTYLEAILKVDEFQNKLLKRAI